MDLWKSFTVVDVIVFIIQVVDVLKFQIVNVCWKLLRSEVVNDFRGFFIIDVEVENILNVVREVGWEGFFDIIKDDIEECQKSIEKFLLIRNLKIC